MCAARIQAPEGRARAGSETTENGNCAFVAGHTTPLFCCGREIASAVEPIHTSGQGFQNDVRSLRTSGCGNLHNTSGNGQSTSGGTKRIRTTVERRRTRS